MAVIHGWVLPQPGTSLRDWSTFTTTFPGPNGGWIKVFAIESCCPTTEPPIEPCDVLLNRGEAIVLMKDLGEGIVKATGRSQYTDIAIIQNRIYARKFNGSLDEYTIGATDITLTTEDVFNIGSGASLASDGVYLIYDVNSGPNVGKIVRISPGSWTPEVFNIPFTVNTQGDIMYVGSNRLAITTYDNGSSLLIIENNPITPTVYSHAPILDNNGNMITAVYGLFQKAGVFYIVRSDGSYYSMGQAWPIVFTKEGQITISGQTFGDWNGAAQTGNCGTITPPVPNPSEEVLVTGTLTTNGVSMPSSFLQNFIIKDSISDILNIPVADLSTAVFTQGSKSDAQSPYTVSFKTNPAGPQLTYKLETIESGGTPVILESGTLPPGTDYSRIITGLTSTDIEIRVTIIRVQVPLTVTAFSSNPYPGIMVSPLEVRDATQYLVNELSVDFSSVQSFTNTVVDCTSPMRVIFNNSGTEILKCVVSRNYDNTGWVTLDTATVNPSSPYDQTFPLTALVEAQFRVEFSSAGIQYTLDARNDSGTPVVELTLNNLKMENSVGDSIITVGTLNMDTPPPTHSYSAYFSPEPTVKVSFDTLDIPGCRMDYLYSNDDGVETLVETINISGNSAYTKSFNSSTATTGYKVVLRFKLT